MGENVRLDKRIIRTKNNLKSALVELLKTRKIEEISIVIGHLFAVLCYSRPRNLIQWSRIFLKVHIK